MTYETAKRLAKELRRAYPAWIFTTVPTPWNTHVIEAWKRTEPVRPYTMYAPADVNGWRSMVRC
jgi:hypothetical protein